jgi:hypothetical protein
MSGILIEKMPAGTKNAESAGTSLGSTPEVNAPRSGAGLGGLLRSSERQRVDVEPARMLRVAALDDLEELLLELW